MFEGTFEIATSLRDVPWKVVDEVLKRYGISLVEATAENHNFEDFWGYARHDGWPTVR